MRKEVSYTECGSLQERLLYNIWQALEDVKDALNSGKGVQPKPAAPKSEVAAITKTEAAAKPKQTRKRKTSSAKPRTSTTRKKEVKR